MGRLLFEAIGERQIVAVQSLVALVATGYVLVNVLVDLAYAVVDPRIRRG
jgi:peptide/nickel transport system permease protein